MVNTKKSDELQTIQKDLDEFVQSKQEQVIWKTPEGAKQLDEVVKYKTDNPEVAIKTLCEYLKKKCGWSYSHRYIFDLIVSRLETENVD
tara:strand:- start:184 stop:450 length:267 start_codon:yes stop_codon:yes gene_type:complete